MSLPLKSMGLKNVYLWLDLVLLFLDGVEGCGWEIALLKWHSFSQSLEAANQPTNKIIGNPLDPLPCKLCLGYEKCNNVERICWYSQWLLEAGMGYPQFGRLSLPKAFGRDRVNLARFFPLFLLAEISWKKSSLRSPPPARRRQCVRQGERHLFHQLIWLWPKGDGATRLGEIGHQLAFSRHLFADDIIHLSDGRDRASYSDPLQLVFRDFPAPLPSKCGQDPVPLCMKPKWLGASDFSAPLPQIQLISDFELPHSFALEIESDFCQGSDSPLGVFGIGADRALDLTPILNTDFTSSCWNM